MVPPRLRTALLRPRSVASHITPPRLLSHHATARVGTISPLSRVALSLLASRHRACSASASLRLRVALCFSHHATAHVCTVPACVRVALLLLISRHRAASFASRSLAQNTVASIGTLPLPLFVNGS
eukprot:6040258-Pleurochrysis_carterae.AAC.1